MTATLNLLGLCLAQMWLASVVWLAMIVLLAGVIARRRPALRAWLSTVGLVGLWLLPIGLTPLAGWRVASIELLPSAEFPPIETASTPAKTHSIESVAIQAEAPPSAGLPVSVAPESKSQASPPGHFAIEATHAPVSSQMDAPTSEKQRPLVAALGTSRSVTWAILLAWVWLVGSAFLAVRLAVTQVHLHFFRRRASISCEGELNDCLRQVQHELGLEACPELRSSAEIDVPVVCGIRRPCIILPVTWLATLDLKEWLLVFRHECAHIVRGDLAWKWVQCLTDILWWPQPLLRVVQRLLADAREIICDNYAIAFSKSSTDYVEAVLALASDPREVRVANMGITFFGGQQRLHVRLKTLIDPMLDRRVRLPRRSKAFLLMGSALLLALTASIQWQTKAVHAETKETTTAEFDLDAFLKDWTAHNAKIESLYAEFVLSYGVLGEPRSTRGSLRYIQPDKFRFDTRYFSYVEDGNEMTFRWKGRDTPVGGPPSTVHLLPLLFPRTPKNAYSFKLLSEDGRYVDLELFIGKNPEWELTIDRHTYLPKTARMKMFNRIQSIEFQGVWTNIEIDPQDFAIAKQVQKAPAAELNPGVIRGVVHNTVGKPVANAEVRIWKKDGKVREKSPPRTTRTDADGRFELGDFEQGRYDVIALKEGFDRSDVVEIDDKKNQSKSLTLVLRPVPILGLPMFADAGIVAATVAGRVLDIDGEPIPNVTVVCHPSSGEIRTVTTDSDGRYRIDQVGHFSDTRVTASLQGYVPKVVPVPSQGRDSAIPLDIILEPSKRIRGRVVNLMGVPIPFARVAVSSNIHPNPWCDAETDFQGRFTVESQDENPSYSVSATGYTPRSICNAALQDGEIVITLEPAGFIAGTLRNTKSSKPGARHPTWFSGE